MPEPFNPKRLTVARRRRGFTKGKLAQEVCVSLRMVSAYEAGAKEPGPLNMARIAEALRFPIEFFGGPDLDEPPLDASSFRALTTMTARQRDQALGSGTLALSLSDWIDEHFSLPEPTVPKMRGIDPETAALAVRSEWGLGERPIANVIHLLEAHGIRVFSLVEECREFDAFSFWRGELPYVFLNTVKSAEHSRMDASHELGHLVLHWNEGARGRNAEREADAFGSAFLMPRDDLVASAPRNAKLGDILQAKRRWNVSAAAFIYRLHKVGMLSEWNYRSLFVEIGRKGYRTVEPEPTKPETSQVFAKVFRALRDDHMSKSDLARQLSIPSDELEKIVFGLVLTAVNGSGDAKHSGDAERRSQIRLI